MKPVLVPHRRQRRDVRTSIATNRREPEEFRGLEQVSDVCPWRRWRVRISEAHVLLWNGIHVLYNRPSTSISSCEIVIFARLGPRMLAAATRTTASTKAKASGANEPLRSPERLLVDGRVKRQLIPAEISDRPDRGRRQQRLSLLFQFGSLRDRI